MFEHIQMNKKPIKTEGFACFFSFAIPVFFSKAMTAALRDAHPAEAEELAGSEQARETFPREGMDDLSPRV